MPRSLGLLLAITSVLLVGCIDRTSPAEVTDKNIVTVIGAIHGQHRRSEKYALDVLEAAVRKFEPDIIMVELPPDRLKIATGNFEQYGEVREDRADDFPELIDVIFPLQRELDFEMIGVAAWAPQIAAARRKSEKHLAQNRPTDWAAYQTAIKRYGQAVSKKSDDPKFVHSRAYDKAVKARQETYERLFGDDLGAGGWDAINKAHIARMTTALDNIQGQKKRVLILFGAWHKYKILEGLEARNDIQIDDPSSLFDH